MKITITQKDIDKGERRDDQHCPIALSLNKMFPDNYIGVEERKMFIEDEEYILPEIAQKFVDDFDSGRPVEPFEFTVCE